MDTSSTQARQRVVIENVEPLVDGGRFPVKVVAGETVQVEADILCDGHDQISAELLFRGPDEASWRTAPMLPLVNDRFWSSFQAEGPGMAAFSIQARVDHYRTWLSDLSKKFEAGNDVSVEIEAGRRMIEEAAGRADAEAAADLEQWSKRLAAAESQAAARSLACDRRLLELMDAHPRPGLSSALAQEVQVRVERPLAGCSAWYEFFPRSFSAVPGRHGTFQDCQALLPDIAEMGFDVVYLPPIHPIGRTNRKGRNNAPKAEQGEPGSPWAIGGPEGGHKAVHPELGSLEDFELFRARAEELGLEVALDMAFQCSMDHPYLAEHPEWFRWRPDGTVQYAENPPKKYQDVVPLDFETEEWAALWQELKSIFEFWIERGVRIFRVDNPHTKPFVFWEWVIGELKKDHPELIFLSEAFTRPKVMHRLAKLGFTQSYTYFTWRNSKQELTEYCSQLTSPPVNNFFWPNFWPNTPDILPEFLQHGGRPAFIIRFILAATLSSNYGIYGPAFELCVNESIPGKEEYLNSEKFEIKSWDLSSPRSLRELISLVNAIRRETPCLQDTRNIRFLETDNEHVIFYRRFSETDDSEIMVAVNLDPFQTRSSLVRIPIDDLGIEPKQPYLVHELIGDEKHIWLGDWNRIELDPQVLPAHIYKIYRTFRRESDFDYFM
jgi:starch synthase (maltosyl-transferring)